MTKTITFDYNDFNTSTRRNADVRKHGDAIVKKDVAGGVYISGPLGCGKTCADTHAALIAYLGGRELLAHRLFG